MRVFACFSAQEYACRVSKVSGASLRTAGSPRGATPTMLSFLIIMCEEVAEILHRLGHLRRFGQHHDAEVVGLRPVEAGAGDDKDVLFVEEVKRELLVAGDVELLDVKLREDVKRAVIFDAGKAVDLRNLAHGRLALFIQPAARDEHRLGAGVVVERGGDHKLGQRVGAKTHRRHLEDALHIVVCLALVAADDHPAAAEAAHDVALGKTVGGDDHPVGRERGGGIVLHAVHHKTVIDLVGEDQKVVFAGHLNDILKHFLRIDGAGRVVGVDDDDGARFRRNLFAHISDVGVPVVLLVAGIKHGLAAGDIGRVGPQGIARRGHQHFVALVEQSQKTHEHQLAHAVADIDVVGRDPLHAFGKVVLANRFAGVGHTL